MGGGRWAGGPPGGGGRVAAFAHHEVLRRCRVSDGGGSPVHDHLLAVIPGASVTPGACHPVPLLGLQSGALGAEEGSPGRDSFF